MRYLLDVNVLIALIDPRHVFHDAANIWFQANARAAWATCPITENGLIRIVGSARYRNPVGSIAQVAEVLRRLRAMPGHEFWPDTLSLADDAVVVRANLTASEQVTDTYLLALAVAQGGRLATFDRRLSTRAVVGGEAALTIIASTA